MPWKGTHLLYKHKGVVGKIVAVKKSSSPWMSKGLVLFIETTRNWSVLGYTDTGNGINKHLLERRECHPYPWRSNVSF